VTPLSAAASRSFARSIAAKSLSRIFITSRTDPVSTRTSVNLSSSMACRRRPTIVSIFS
jgi:hypothetical protein